ncbi:MAG: lipopolysaccharide heptosyltransferase II [Candidatus Omnitrophica bacterium]|nr:lipopolysaccharide heptosyltransferase II [Candidatus Omnitrophota bacterium]
MNILIFTKNWLGDILFQLPAIEAIKRKYPSAFIACIAPLRCHDILKAHPDIDEVYLFDEKNTHRSLLAKINFIRQLRKKNWDAGYLFHRSMTRALVLFLAGVETRIGYRAKRRAFLTSAVEEPSGRMHQVDYFLHLAYKSGVPVNPGAAYHFYYSSKASDYIAQILMERGLQPGRFVCFHLGANWEPKQWPPEHFSALADKIHAAFQFPVVITGAETDWPLAEKFRRHVQTAPFLILTGQTSLEELGALFAQSAFVVTGDSGPMHIAAGSGAKVLALFGPTDPELTGPRGTGPKKILHFVPDGFKVPWYSDDLPKDGWLSKISPEQVFETILQQAWVQVPGSQKSGID